MDSILSPEKLTHAWLEDTLALLFDTLMISFGIILFRQTGALTGGMAGMTFLIHYATYLPFGVVFFVINLPLYWLSVRRMGAALTLKAFCAVGLVSLSSDLHGYFIHVDRLNLYHATPFGNIMVSIDSVALFRHRASLGGVNILALYLQDKGGIRTGKFQMVVDACIVTTSLWVVSLPVLLVSILDAIILNSIATMNHRPGRCTMQWLHL